MENFIVAMIAILLFNILVKIVWIHTGKFPARTVKSEFWDIMIFVPIIAWGVTLLY